MKRILFLLLILGFIQVNAQLPSNCDVPEELRKYYEFDVANMAVKWIYAIQSPDTALIDIPSWCQDTIWSGLAAIYNRHDQVEADSVFNKYCIHIDIGLSIWKQIVVYVDTTYAWTSNWMNLQTITGIPAFDSLLVKYGFTVSQFSHGHTGNNFDHDATLVTSQSINERALCDSIESFPGVFYAFQNSMSSVGAYPGIEFNDTSGVKSYSFTLGWGMANYHTWNYKVNHDCSIELLDVINNNYEPYPVPSNCDILYVPDFTNPSIKMNVYPNPSFNNIIIESSAEGYFSILNVSGKELLNRYITKSKTIVDISNLPVGVYFIKLKNENSIEVRKFIKE